MILFAGTSRFKNKSTLERVNPKKTEKMDTPIDGFLIQLIQAVHWNFDGLNFYFRQTWRTLYFDLFSCYKISKTKTYMNH